jgi:hypothetical protein
VRLYVNGIEVTAFNTSNNPTSSADLGVNGTHAHGIGRPGAQAAYYFNGSLADIHFIDSQALTPSAFGEFDTNGVWQPIAYAGSYGTNGFHLPFSDNSTAAALGTDTSSNGNTWTVNNISVTAGAGNDSVVDSPTNYGTDTGAGGEVRGNYATLNPLSSALTLVNGNLDFNKGSAADWKVAKSTFFVATGKWYWEVTVAAYSSGTQPIIFGIANASSPLSGTDTDITTGLNGYFKDGQKRVNSTTSSYGASYTNGDVIGFAFDLDAGTLTAYKNGSSQGTLMSSITGSWTPAIGLYTGSTQLTSDSLSINFGQRPFAYTAPSGFKALCTTNLPTGSITTSGSFTGNANADGPFVYLNGVPTAMTINSNAVTFATHADKLSNGFKLRTSSGSYNTAGSNTYSITTTGAEFKFARAQPNP